MRHAQPYDMAPFDCVQYLPKKCRRSCRTTARVLCHVNSHAHDGEAVHANYLGNYHEQHTGLGIIMGLMASARPPRPTAWLKPSYALLTPAPRLRLFSLSFSCSSSTILPFGLLALLPSMGAVNLRVKLPHLAAIHLVTCVSHTPACPVHVCDGPRHLSVCMTRRLQVLSDGEHTCRHVRILCAFSMRQKARTHSSLHGVRMKAHKHMR